MKLVDHAKAHLIVVPVGAVGGLIEAGAVRIGDRIGKINDEVTAEESLHVDPAAIASLAITPEPIPLVIVHEDRDVIVVDKPAGMHVHPLGAYRTGTLVNALLWHAGARPDQPWGLWRPRPLHRLDRAARGVTAFAKSPGAFTIERTYRALVAGVVTQDAGTIDAPLGRDPANDYRRSIRPDGQRAVTHWHVLARSEPATTVLELSLETGRTHQIRAHLASIGHPIVGDSLYAGGPPSASIELYAYELRIGDVTATSPAATVSACGSLPRSAPGRS